MSYIFAITGKGGVGKTTIAALLVSRLIHRGCRPVFAVDADPNNCLDDALGVTVENTVGSIREETRELVGQGLTAGVSKQELLEIKIAECLVEADDFDLIAMGRPEGPGCYCYANNVLKLVLSEISSHYPYVVLDNEAGLENLSRRLVQKVDVLVLITDPSQRGLETVRRLHALAGEMDMHYDRLVIMINRLRGDRWPENVMELKTLTGADFVVGLPDDAEIALLGENGQAIRVLSPGNPLNARLDEFLDRVGL